MRAGFIDLMILSSRASVPLGIAVDCVGEAGRVWGGPEASNPGVAASNMNIETISGLRMRSSYAPVGRFASPTRWSGPREWR